MSAADRGWGNPDSPNFRDNIIKLVVADTFVYVHKNVYAIFRDLLNELHKHFDIDGYPLDDWGYNNRDVRGHPGVKSNHAWGLAVDIDATENPMTTNPAARHEFGANIVHPLLGRYEGLIEWGGDYGTRKDYMHFEFMGTPNQAKLLSARLSMEATVAKLDAEDLKNIRKIVSEEVTEIYRVLVGNPGDTDSDPTHMSLNDLARLIKKD